MDQLLKHETALAGAGASRQFITAMQPLQQFVGEKYAPVWAICATLADMRRMFKTADHDATLDMTMRLGDRLLPDHLARFAVDTIAHLRLPAFYQTMPFRCITSNWRGVEVKCYD